MRFSSTFSYYIGRHFLFWLCCVFITLLGISALFDVVEMLRRISGKAHIPPDVALKMTLLKLPYLGFELMPFIFLIAALLAFWRLAKAKIGRAHV